MRGKLGIGSLLAAGLSIILTASVKAAEGEDVYRKICSYCHDDGQMQAPRLGDKAAWKERAQKPKETLYRSALEGKGHMPSRSGAQDFSDDDVKRAVDYIVRRAQ